LSRRQELTLTVVLLLLAAGLRVWDLTRLPQGFNTTELANIRMTETIRHGHIAIHYQVGDGIGRAGLYPLGNAVAATLVGDGLLGYRVFSLGAGLVFLALLYALARRLFGPPVGLIALALGAVNLQSILLARSATPETFVPLFAALAMFMLARAFHLHRDVVYHLPATFPFAVLGVLFGLSGYLHYSTLVLGPVGALFFMHLVVTGQPLARRVWRAMAFVIVLATIVAVPYLISAFREPSLSEPYILYTERPQSVTEAIDGVLGAFGGLVWRGDPNITRNLPSVSLLGPVMAILMVIGVLEGLRRWREPRYALLLLMLLAGLLTDAWIRPEPTFSANLVAWPSLFIFPGVGAAVLARELRGRGWSNAWTPVSVLMVIALVVAGAISSYRLFRRWPEHPDTAAAYQSHLAAVAAYLDRTPDGPPVSICTYPMRGISEVGLTARQTLNLMMHREGLEIRHSDCETGLVFINAGAPMRFIYGSERGPEVMRPELKAWLDEATPIDVPDLPEGTVMRVDVEERIMDAGGYAWGQLAETYFVEQATPALTRAPLAIKLEQNLTFAGYDLFPRERPPGGTPIVLVTYWRVDGPLPPDVGIFAHLVDYWESRSGDRYPLEEPWAESNSLDVMAANLENRDFFAQVLYIYMREDLAPGEYALVIGAYRDNVFNRLGVLDSATGQRRGERLSLGTITLVPPSDTQANSP
jgi:4-amino-4-deoxy-L-arabinose transferase-like glycosyltransferase